MIHHTYANRLGARRWRAHCQSCSWSGRCLSTRGLAEAEGKAHERDAERRAAA